MNIPGVLALTHKVFRKLKVGKIGGNISLMLNKTLNRPKIRINNEKDAESFLNSIHKDVKSSAICENEIVAPTCDLQIIMPVYNTGEFLRDSINSVLNQATNYSFHLVIVNDGSTDNSSEILSDFEYDKRVTIINQSNKGLSGARNRGLQKIFGKYITFLDSDDILAPNAITSWMDAAYKYDAEVVEGSFQRRTPDGNFFGGCKWQKEAIENRSKMQGYAWLKIYKADLWKNLHFPECYWYEDTIICGLITPKVNTYVQIPSDVYYYTINKGSISFNSRGRNKMLDNIFITKSVLQDAYKLSYINDSYDYYYKYLIYQTHTNWDRTYLLGADSEYAVFKESCYLFNKYFPNDIKSNDFPTRLANSLRKEDFNLYRKSNLLDF